MQLVFPYPPQVATGQEVTFEEVKKERVEIKLEGEPQQMPPSLPDTAAPNVLDTPLATMQEVSSEEVKMEKVEIKLEGEQQLVFPYPPQFATRQEVTSEEVKMERVEIKLEGEPQQMPSSLTDTAAPNVLDTPPAAASPAADTTPSRRGRKRIRCAIADCTVKNCNHCTCKGECGRGHKLGECGNDRYGTRANCNQCKVAFYYIKKKKRAREAALAEAALIESGAVVPPPPKEPAVKKAKMAKKPKAATAKEAKKKAAAEAVPDMDDYLFGLDCGMGSQDSFYSSDSTTDFEDDLLDNISDSISWSDSEVDSQVSEGSCPSSPAMSGPEETLCSLFDFSDNTCDEDIDGWAGLLEC
jgi:hypothetical protein